MGQIVSTRTLHLAAAQDWLCAYCGRGMTRSPKCSTTATVDHVIPTSRGGANSRENIVAACWRCNNLKGSMTGEEFWFRYPNPETLPEPSRSHHEKLIRLQEKEANRARIRAQKAAMEALDAKWTDRMRNPPYEATLAAKACLAEFAPHLVKAIPWQLRLDRAWNALWAQCISEVDRRRVE